MAYLKIIITMLFIVTAGCFSSENSEVRDLKHDLKFTTEQLESCNNSLKVYRDGGQSTQTETESATTAQPEPEVQSTPEYETVPVYNIETKHGKAVCYTRSEQDITCGVTFEDCKDGYVYRCITDVKYKITEEQKLIQ